jgi:hypothetical protein
MAISSNLDTRGFFTASTDLSTKQFHFVKMSGNKQVTVCAAITDKPIGILQNNPAAGEAAVVAIRGTSKVVADGTLAFGDVIGTSADGQADAIVNGVDVTVFVAGQAIEAAAAGDTTDIELNITNTLAT